MSSRRIYIDPQNIDFKLIKEISSWIREGKIGALPTETVYGIAANLDREDAVKRLYSLKGRDPNKASTIHIALPADADFFIDVLPPYGYRLIEKFWPGPLTIIYYQKDSPQTIGLRCPDHPVTSLILKEALCRVIMPSANISGQPPALSAEEVERVFDGGLDFIVDSLPPRLKVSSTVVDLTLRPPRVVREGAIPQKSIEEVLTSRRVLFVCTGNTCRSVMAEYLLKLYLNRKKPQIADKIEILSAGVSAQEGFGPSAETEELLRGEGINAAGHISKRIDRYLIRSSDIIIVMEPRHKDIIVGMDNLALSRIFLMGSFLKNHQESIPDPIGKSFEEFRQVFNLIRQAVEEIVDWLG